MPSRVETVLAKARDLLVAFGSDSIEKTIWGSPAGKKKIAGRLAAMLPPHHTYVEPFAGSAAVLFAKEPSLVEVINDADPEIAEAYSLLKNLTKRDLARLRKMAWMGDEATFKKMFDSKPADPVARLHRFLYVTHFSYGKLRGRSFNPNAQGATAKTIARIEQFGPRLKRVKVFSGDYEKVVRKFDGKNTALFLDPPYPGYNVDVGESSFDEERFFERLKTLKGKFLITYGVRGKFPAMVKGSDFWVKRIRTPRTIAAMRGVGGSSVLTQLLVANYEPVTKALEADCELDDWNGEPAPPETPGNPFDKSGALIKGLDPNDERFVLGIVLEPEVVDAQGDIYSAEEIRRAAHRFMEEFGGLGLMHRLRVNGEVKVLESYLAPADVDVGEFRVRKGTWMLAVRVLSDELWERVKSGDLTGFSIGGSARRVPEAAPPVEAETPEAPRAPETEAA